MNSALFTRTQPRAWSLGWGWNQPEATVSPPGFHRPPERLPPLRKCFVNEISMQMLFYYYYAIPAPRAGDL